MTIFVPLKRGFTIYPFIFLPKRVKGTVLCESYNIHEQTHYQRQKGNLIKWIWKYLTNKKFRFEEEKMAYKAEIDNRKLLGIWIDKDYYARVMSEGYIGMCTYDEAMEWLKSL